MNLSAIQRELTELRSHPEQSQDIAAEAALLLRAAYEIALAQGLTFQVVGELVTPAQAILEVNRILAAIEPERFLLIRDVAKILSVSQDKVAEWIKSNRLEAVNVANKGKRPQFRIPREALRNLQPEKTYKPKFL